MRRVRLVSQARPKQLKHRSLSVSCTGKVWGHLVGFCVLHRRDNLIGYGYMTLSKSRTCENAEPEDRHGQVPYPP